MALPLIPAMAIGGFATSAYGNLYRQSVQRRLYDQLGKGYSALDLGYRRYLKTQGRRINPNRALGSYYGQALRSRANIDSSYGSSLGTVGGVVGAGSLTGAKTWRFMK